MTGELRILFRAALCALVLSGCDDVSPLRYQEPPEDAALVDHADPERVAACQQCATDPGSTCRAKLDDCEAQRPGCGELLQCLTDTDCWRQLNVKNLGDPPPCGVLCLSRTHVTSINEIGVPATGFYLCVIDEARCAPACMDAPQAAARDR